MRTTRRFWLADYIGGDLLVDGWFFYVGRLMVRWQRRALPEGSGSGVGEAGS